MLLIRYTSQAQPNNLFSVQWWLRVVTRTAKGDIVSGYTRATWAALCAEVGKLKVSVLDGKLLELATAERTYRNRWTISWALQGLNPSQRSRRTARISWSPTVSQDPARTLVDSRTGTVASLATALAEAVLAGDQEQARALAEEMRALQARSPTDLPPRRLRRAT